MLRIIFLLLIPITAHSDALLDVMYAPFQAFKSLPPAYIAPKVQEDSNDENYEYFDAYGSDAEHYSWDDIYLCQYCETEIIIDPYASNEVETDEE